MFEGRLNGKRVAVKKLLLSDDSKHREQVLSSFAKEVALMTALPDHENILRLIAVCHDPPGMYIDCRRMDGND